MEHVHLHLFKWWVANMMDNDNINIIKLSNGVWIAPRSYGKSMAGQLGQKFIEREGERESKEKREFGSEIEHDILSNILRQVL